MLEFYVLLVSFCSVYGGLLYANLGDNITLPCFYPSASKHLSWYKQAAGQQPQIISSFYKPVVGSNKFTNEFQDNKRFSVHVGEGFYNLNISHVQDSDSAMYYCGHTSLTVTVFENGTFLMLKDSSCRNLLQHLKSDTVKPEADAGRHRCAVALCGELLFGTGARLPAGDLTGQQCNTPPVLVYCVVAALVVSGMLNIILICISCQTSTRTYHHCEDRRPHHQPEYTSDSQNETSDTLQYAALDFKRKRDTSRREMSTDERTIYSGVRPARLK